MSSPNFDFSTKYTFDSKEMPGVKVTIRRLSEMKRAKRDAAIAAQQIRLAEIDMEMEEASKPYRSRDTWEVAIPDDAIEERDGAKVLKLSRAQAVSLRGSLPSQTEVPDVPNHVAVSLARLSLDRELILSEFMRPATLRAGVISIEGLSYDGKPGTVDLLLEHGPDALIEEIDREIQRHGGLTVEQQKNSSSPSDSGVPVVEATTPTSAATA